jgi:hypothetical protein
MELRAIHASANEAVGRGDSVSHLYATGSSVRELKTCVASIQLEGFRLALRPKLSRSSGRFIRVILQAMTRVQWLLSCSCFCQCCIRRSFANGLVNTGDDDGE